MIAFAANSLLTRLALDTSLIDATSFLCIRVISAAIMLWLIIFIRNKRPTFQKPNFKMALALFVYGVGFSYAYISLQTGTGALILFGSVQITMFAIALIEQEKFSYLAWLGLFMALGGLIYLVAPGATAPEPRSAILMTIAGIAWGGFSALGRGTKDPLLDNAQSFILCCPLVILVYLYAWPSSDIKLAGILLALASGALASALGYVIWYSALPYLRAGQAATVQLSVPIIAAIGGVIFIAEPITMRLVFASLLTLCGIALVLSQREAK